MGEDSPRRDERVAPQDRKLQTGPILDWIRGAETHLAALQSAHDSLSKPVESILRWIESAEAHLAPLQTDHDRMRAQYERHYARMDQMLARIASIEARLIALEHNDTAIAISIAQLPSADSNQ